MPGLVRLCVRRAQQRGAAPLSIVLTLIAAVLAAAVGVGSSVLKFVSPLPYPITETGLVVGIWFLIGVIYLA